MSLEAELLRAGLEAAPLDPATMVNLRRSVDAILTTTRRASAIANALRTLARDSAADPEERVAIRDLFQNANALCRARCESEGVRLEFDDPHAAVASGRPAELLHVITNLLDNAIYAAARGERWVRVKAARVDDEVILRCVDGGPGISGEDLPKVGTPLFTTKPLGNGSGLGIALVRHLVERGRGELRIDVGPPTTFEVRLPACPDAS